MQEASVNNMGREDDGRGNRRWLGHLNLNAAPIVSPLARPWRGCYTAVIRQSAVNSKESA